VTTATPATPRATAPGRLAELARAAAAPLACGVVLVVLLATWVAGGGGGAVSRVRISITSATVPMVSYTTHSAAGRNAAVYLTMRNLTGSGDTLISASSPSAGRVVLARSGPGEPASIPGGITVPAHGSVSLSPFGPDLVLIRPHALMSGEQIVLRLRFQRAGLITVTASVTPPGTP